MKHVNLISHAISIIALLVVLTGCGGNQNAIVGTWRATEGSVFGRVYSFESDGQLFISEGNSLYKGTYRLISNDLLEYSAKNEKFGDSLTDSVNIDISGKVLTMKFPSGQSYTFEKTG